MEVADLLFIKLIDLGFDFADDQDDYEVYDDRHLSTGLTDAHDPFSTGSKDGSSTLLEQQQGDGSDRKSKSDDGGKTLPMNDDADPQEQKSDMVDEQTDAQTDHLTNNNEPNILIASNMLLEAPPLNESYSSNSLLEAILTEGKIGREKDRIARLI